MREASTRSGRVAAVIVFGLGLGLGLLTSPPSSAIEMTQVGGPTVVDVGDTFTIELALDNASRDVVQGIEVDMSGLAGTANVVSGRAAQYYFALFCSTPTLCFGAIESSSGGFFDRNDLTRGGYARGDDTVELNRALALNPTSADGSLDPGVDRDGEPVDIRVTLQTIGLGSLSIVSRYSNGTDVLRIPGSPLTIRIVPEPATALLVGLGLGGLAAPLGGSPRRRSPRSDPVMPPIAIAGSSRASRVPGRPASPSRARGSR